MKKHLITFISLLVILLHWGCSEDDSNMIEDTKTEISGKNMHSADGVIGIEGSSEITCAVEFTYHSPFLSEAQKDSIRNWYNANHFTIYQILQIDSQTEYWVVFCNEYDNYLDSLGTIGDIVCDDNGNCIDTTSIPCNSALCGNGSGGGDGDFPIDDTPPDH